MRYRDRSSRRSSWVASFLVALAGLGLGLAGSPHASWASGTPNVVFLVQDCAASGHTLGQDCFQDLDTLQTYLWAPQTGVNPTASTPMAVEIGPGTFTGSLSCPANGGYVSFRGAGREQTVLHQTSPADQTVLVESCYQLNFQDLTIQAPPSGGPNGHDASVFWSGCGSSTWTNVDLLVRGSTGVTSPWWEDGDSCKAIHYWFGSRWLNEGDGTDSFGSYILSDQNWFYGGEIRYEGSAATPSPAQATAVYVADTGDLRVYGALVRASVGQATNVDYNSGVSANYGIHLNGAWVFGYAAIFHMHGGMIAADASNSTVPVSPYGVTAAAGGFAHILDTSFNVIAGHGGTATRLLTNPVGASAGVIRSAFQWPAGADPPRSEKDGTGALIKSLTGDDTFVETDCSNDGNCDAGGNQTHLMIYNTAACPNSKWFDTSTRRCRNDTVGGGT